MNDLPARRRAPGFAARAVALLVVTAAAGGVTGAVRARSDGSRSVQGIPAADRSPSPTPEPSGETPTPSASPTSDPEPTATPTADEPPTSSASSASAAPPPVVPTRRPTTASVRCGTGTLMTNGTISGVVVDEAGRPVSGMEIFGAGCATDVTGADGRFAVPCRDDAYRHWGVATPFRWHVSGPQRVSTTAVGFGWIGPPLETVPCGTTHRVVVRAPATVEVRVVDAKWAPVGDVGFVLYVGYSEGGEYVVSGRTDGDGVFRVRALAPGPYTAYGTRNGRPLRATLIVRAGETQTATLTTTGASAPPSPTPSATPTPSPTTAAPSVPPDA